MTDQFLQLLIAAAALAAVAEAHNITAILEGFPDYSLYNQYLSETRVADEINTRETVTCLVLPNAAVSSLAGNHSLAGIKNALRLLTLLDYFDPPKLHSLPSGTTLTTTLLQTTGDASGNTGFVNITNLRGGRVAFGSAAQGSELVADYTKSVKLIPYNISVLAISAPIVFPGLLDAPSTAGANLTAVLEKAGCKTFAGLLVSSGVLKMYQDAMDKGLTVLAPSDEAFKAPGVPDLQTLTTADLVTLLQYHALPSYTPKDSLKAAAGGIRTLASTGTGKYELSTTARGDDVSLVTGVDTSRIANTVLDSTPVCVMTVDNLLLPVELFGKAPSPAPGPAPFVAPSPAPPTEAPAPASAAKTPSPMPLSPPAPPTAAPGGSPAEAPGEAADQKSDENSATAAGVKPLCALATAVVVYWAVASVL